MATYDSLTLFLTHLPVRVSNMQQSITDEQIALLSDDHAELGERQRTPIPKLQLAIVLLLQPCEVVGRNSILPYINQVHLVHLCHDLIHVLIIF